MWRPGGTKPIRAVEKLLLVDGLQYHRHRPLEHLILKGRHRDRTTSWASLFWNVGTPHRRSVVRSRLETIQQSRQVLVEVLCISLGGLAIDANRPILAGSPIGLLQERYVNVM